MPDLREQLLQQMEQIQLDDRYPPRLKTWLLKQAQQKLEELEFANGNTECPSGTIQRLTEHDPARGV